MKGYKVLVGRNPESSGLMALFSDKTEAEEWGKAMLDTALVKQMSEEGQESKYKLHEVEVEKCSMCPRLLMVEDGGNVCLRCEDLLHDAQQQAAEDRAERGEDL